MKSIFKYLNIAFSILFLSSCEDELKVTDSYPFQVSILGNKEASSSNTLENELKIKTENVTDDTIFSFSYNANEKGYYKIDDAKISENEIYNLTNGTLIKAIEFVPLTDGELEVEFFITNNKQHSTTINTTYSITKELTDFEFSFIPLKEEVILGERIGLNLNIEQTSDEVLTYSVNVSSNSNGEINWGGYSNLPQTIDNLSQGNYTLEYFPTEVIDKNSFIVTVTASNGIAKTKTFEGLNVAPVDFDFDLSKSVITVKPSMSNDFVSITLNRPSFVTGYYHDVKYYLRISTTTNGILLDNGTINFGQNIQLNDFSGVSNETFLYSLIYSGSVISGELTFTVFNDTGFEVSKSVAIEVIE